MDPTGFAASCVRDVLDRGAAPHALCRRHRAGSIQAEAISLLIVRPGAGTTRAPC